MSKIFKISLILISFIGGMVHAQKLVEDNGFDVNFSGRIASRFTETSGSAKLQDTGTRIRFDMNQKLESGSVSSVVLEIGYLTDTNTVGIPWYARKAYYDFKSEKYGELQVGRNLMPSYLVFELSDIMDGYGNTAHALFTQAGDVFGVGKSTSMIRYDAMLGSFHLAASVAGEENLQLGSSLSGATSSSTIGGVNINRHYSVNLAGLWHITKSLTVGLSGVYTDVYDVDDTGTYSDSDLDFTQYAAGIRYWAGRFIFASTFSYSDGLFEVNKATFANETAFVYLWSKNPSLNNRVYLATHYSKTDGYDQAGMADISLTITKGIAGPTKRAWVYVQYIQDLREDPDVAYNSRYLNYNKPGNQLYVGFFYEF